MARSFADIAFTPAVRTFQTRMGSRRNYAPLDAIEDHGVELTERETDFIAARDGFYQATVGETGWPYVQFRGGPAGFLKVIDSKTIGYADFRGNVQYISAGNLAHDGRIALILIDYAERRRLKLWGRARLVDVRDDSAMVERLPALTVNHCQPPVHLRRLIAQRRSGLEIGNRQVEIIVFGAQSIYFAARRQQIFLTGRTGYHPGQQCDAFLALPALDLLDEPVAPERSDFFLPNFSFGDTARRFSGECGQRFHSLFNTGMRRKHHAGEFIIVIRACLDLGEQVASYLRGLRWILACLAHERRAYPVGSTLLIAGVTEHACQHGKLPDQPDHAKESDKLSEGHEADFTSRSRSSVCRSSLAWGGAQLIALFVLGVNILARVLFRKKSTD